MRVHLIDTGDGDAEIGTGEATGQFLTWFTRAANPALTGIKAWLWPPTAAGGLGVLPVPAVGVAALRTKVAVAWQARQAGGEAGR